MELQKAQFGEQLPMFMTAGEIRQKHGLWDADRKIVGNDGKTKSDIYRETGRYPKPNEIGQQHPESDTEMMDRKYTEAKRYRRYNDDSGKGASLAEEIRMNGAIEKPIHLSPNKYIKTSPEDPSKTKFADGKGQQWDRYVTGRVLGGHHRIAVHEHEAPNTLLPVMFHESMEHARQSGHYA